MEHGADIQQHGQAAFFPFTVPHQHLRSMAVLRCSTKLICNQLISDYTEMAGRSLGLVTATHVAEFTAKVWENQDRVGDAPNEDKTKDQGHFKHKEVKKIATKYLWSSTVTPPFADDVEVEAFICPQLHAKLCVPWQSRQKTTCIVLNTCN